MKMKEKREVGERGGKKRNIMMEGFCEKQNDKRCRESMMKMKRGK